MTAAVLGACLVGLALGLLGAGGSILTVPVLVYGAGLPEKEAIAASLAIVALIAGLGTLLEARRGYVRVRAVLYFGVPGMAGALAGGGLASLVPAALQMGLFAVVVLAAAHTMARPPRAEGAPAARGAAGIGAAGAGVGLVTGLVGVGGGFLIVPALLRFAGLELRAAMASSLALIMLNGLAGLAAQLGSGAVRALPLGHVAVFAGLGAAGLIAGQYGARLLPRRVVRAVFTATLAAVGVFTLAKAALAG